MHPLILNRNEIQSKDDKNYQTMTKSLGIENIEKKEEDELKFGENKQKDGMMQRINNYKKSTAGTLNHIDLYCDYFEKYKNLIKWKDPQMTQYFFYVMIILFFIVTFLPIRFFIAIGYVYKWFKG